MTKKKIMIVISSLRPGGAERVSSLLASSWSAEGHEVSFLTWLPAARDHYKLPPAVKRFSCLRTDQGRVVSFFAPLLRIFWLRRLIKRQRPDVVVSFIDRTNVVAVAAAAGTGIPVIISERIDPCEYNPGYKWRGLRNLFYGLADRVVVQTQSIRDKVSKLSFFSAEIRIIPNPVSREFFMKASGREPLVFSAGRLTPQKGFDVLIRAFASVHREMEGFKLVIAGEGPEEKHLKELAASLGCSSKITFPGVLEDIGYLYRQAAIFVLSSRFEGFPNVLLEAMASGCAVISTDCPSGPAEIVTDERDGLLVPVNDEGALASALLRLSVDKELREKLAADATEKAMQFSVERIMSRWNSLISELFPDVG